MNMRWQLQSHGWPVGAHFIDVGTIIEGPDFRNPITGLPLPIPLPINARALDQEAYDLMCEWVNPEWWHLLSYDPHFVTPK
jgi:hypothetical protein